jgi:hypothetical protein
MLAAVSTAPAILGRALVRTIEAPAWRATRFLALSLVALGAGVVILALGVYVEGQRQRADNRCDLAWLGVCACRAGEGRCGDL